MSIIDQLAFSLGRRDEIPNQELAARISKAGDIKAVAELVEHLDHKKKDIRHDCIKVLYEIAYLTPALIAPYADKFVKLLDDKNNRMVWGAMTALDEIAAVNPSGIYQHLGKILKVADAGSVITKDHAVAILTKLAKEKVYAEEALTLLLDHFKTSLTNQLPKYAEDALPVIPAGRKKDFIQVLQSRLDDIDKDSKRKRVEKVIQKLSQ